MVYNVIQILAHFGIFGIFLREVVVREERSMCGS